MSSEKLVVNILSNGIKKLNSFKFPEKINDIAKNLIIDISGVTFAGSNTESASIIYNLAKETYLNGNCKIIGIRESLNPAGAAFVNGALGHSLDFDDNCYAGVVHGSTVVFPAVLAYAQNLQLSGSELLKGFIIGLEIQFALAKAFTNKIYDRGWWTTSLFGSIGSTAGVASLTNLKNNEIENALAISLSGVGAIRAIRGSNAKHYYCGKAAEIGITSTNIAGKGASGPVNVFEDKNGLLNILNNKEFNYIPIKNIGNNFSLLDPGVDIKKYPVCFASHAAADSVNWILKSKKIKIEEIIKVICTVPQIIASNLTYNNPRNVKEAQFSMQFAISIVIKYGSIQLDYLDAEYLFNESIQKLMKKIVMEVGCLPKSSKQDNQVICPEWSNVKVLDKYGNSYEKFMGAPIGSSQKPLTQKMLFEKFKSCIEFSKTSYSSEILYDKLINIEKIKNCRDLF